MAPKGKKAGGGKSKGSTGGVVDGMDTSEMTREQLEQHVARLRQEMDREREERNFFQLERDKLRTFWEISLQQLEEIRAELRNKDKEMEEQVDDHQAKENVFKQRVKHLLYEHLGNIADLKAESMVSLKVTQEQFDKQEKLLLEDKKKLKEQLVEQKRDKEEEIRTLKMELSEKLSEIRSELMDTAAKLEASYACKVADLREQLQLKHVTELAEVEERKNKHIADLVRNQDAAFLDMKNYYNDVTLNNLALISSLKEQMEEMKRREERMEKVLKEVQKENKCLSEPMKKAKEEAAELSRQLTNYQKDKASLTSTKQTLVATQKELQVVRWEREALEQRLAGMTQERDEIKSRFDSAVFEVQRKAGLKNVFLERKVQALADLLEQQDELSVESRDHGSVQELFAKKNARIRQLEDYVQNVTKDFNNLLAACTAKLEELGAGEEVLRFSPLTSP